MKLLNQRAYEFGLLLVTSVFLTACASEPVIVDLSANHPANPRSPETAFIPPSNPFQYTIPMVEHEGEGSSSMTHEKHQPAHQHQMSPNMGHESMPSQGSEEQNPEHQHKEHSQ
ncbi:MAG: hypothetical protein HKO68_09145 [Desulfobacterales bacterium]|nr:hypothetical protein [Desulfobacterales bacterium]